MSDSSPNWFNGAASDMFTMILSEYAGLPNQHYLQIGAWTGDASLWLMENVLTHPSNTLTDVDVWDLDIPPNYISLANYNLTDIEKEYDHKLKSYTDKIIKVKSTSHAWLAQNQDKQYDFIYIDGDHSAKAVVIDGLLAWDLLKIGGIMAFDDFTWEHPNDFNPGIGIDFFLKLYTDKLEFITKGHQLWIRKIVA